ncbi:ribosome biogenesis protein NEP1 [Achlya hypogyna]|uniref:Ribosome biogenesis protein NEP1 n=1 Tax=Achlya hypogyna TaxID=1202772 RepID=A0A1V9Z5C1_ACHHY|nr:ribosome biogenesis protein NEP1 [Achlya hypogyna]
MSSKLETKPQVIVILENAALETVKTAKGFQLLNCDDHRGIHKKHNKDPSASRPDILHQELMALLDSPLNKAGYLKVYIRSAKNVIIEVSPQMRVPRTYKRFAGLMVQLLHTLKIRSSDGKTTMLKVIKNPIDMHLPPNVKKYGCSCTGNLIDPWDFATKLPVEPVVFVLGAMAHGHITKEMCPYIDEMISVSEYPLSGAQAVARLLNSFERHYGIL